MDLRRLVPLLVLSVVAGCSMPFLSDLAPKAETDAGRQVFTHLQRREFDAVEAMLSPEIAAKVPPRPALEKLSASFPADPPKSVQVIGSSTNV